MGRNAKDAKFEIRQTILRFADELNLNPKQISALSIVEAWDGGTFSLIKQTPHVLNINDADNEELQDDHPNGGEPNFPNDPLEKLTANLKRQGETIKARKMTHTLTQEVQTLIRSRAFNERILSDARDHAAGLVREYFVKAFGPGKTLDAGAQSVAPPIIYKTGSGEAEPHGEAETNANATKADAAAHQADNEARPANDIKNLRQHSNNNIRSREEMQYSFYFAALKNHNEVGCRKTISALVKKWRKVVADGDGHQAFVSSALTITVVSIDGFVCWVVP
ncbi:MAG: hypothetical protein NXI18_12665 [Alphaproteobacteria bacterium]|nr:hypothetical protein [Alphaproteobacteria bacterium]